MFDIVSNLSPDLNIINNDLYNWYRPLFVDSTVGGVLVEMINDNIKTETNISLNDPQNFNYVHQ